jgi:hypothetical protein
MLIGARRQSYEALAHCSLPVADLRESTMPEDTDKKIAGAGFLEKIRVELERAGKTAKADPRT